VTRQHVARLCRRFALQSPQWYVSNARLLAAAYDIETSSVPVKRVAHRLGFQSSAGLYGMFRRQTGLEWSALREIGVGQYMERQIRNALRLEVPFQVP